MMMLPHSQVTNSNIQLHGIGIKFKARLFLTKGGFTILKLCPRVEIDENSKNLSHCKSIRLLTIL